MRTRKRTLMTLGLLWGGLLALMAGCPMHASAPTGDFDGEKTVAALDLAAADSDEGGVFATDVMQQKLDDAVATLTADEPVPDNVAQQAVDQVMEALFISNLVILPTAGVPEAGQNFGQTFLPMSHTAEQALDFYLSRSERVRCDFDGDFDVDLNDFGEFQVCNTGPSLGPPDPGCEDKDFDNDNDVDQTDFGQFQLCFGLNAAPAGENAAARAFEARNFIQVFREAALTIGQQTATCNPNNLIGPGCGQLQADDEAGVVVDDIVPGFSKSVRGPFFVAEPSEDIQEQVIVPGGMAPGSCSVVLKEIQGVRAVIRPVLIPIWVEPWFARATIVGFQTVWVWEFIPAEFLKTITHCNQGGVIVSDVQIQTVLERELLQFWSFPGKEFTAAGSAN